jgi:hypothetical protein
MTFTVTNESTGKALGNPVLQTEGRVTLIDGILATAVLLGLVRAWPLVLAVAGRAQQGELLGGEGGFEFGAVVLDRRPGTELPFLPANPATGST